MSLLVRKITRNKWPNELVQKNNLSADVAGDFRSNNSLLSLWEIDSIEQIQDAMLAIATSCDNISRMDFVILESAGLSNINVNIQQESSPNAYVSYSDKHWDMTNVTYESLGNIIAYAHKNMLKEGYHKRFKEKEVKKLLIKAIQDKKVEFDKLTERMKKYLAPDLGIKVQKCPHCEKICCLNDGEKTYPIS